MNNANNKLYVCLLSTVLFLTTSATGNESDITLSAQEYVTLAEQAFDKSDIVASMRLYRKAADAGYAPAQSRLAYLLDKAEDNDEAFLWYQKAASQNNASAQFGLGQMYAEGEGTKQDYKQALHWFTKSAEQGHAPAIRTLARTYERGSLGLRVDYEQSQSWLQKGIDIDDQWSIKRMIQAYKTGDLGLMINKQKAKQLETSLLR